MKSNQLTAPDASIIRGAQDGDLLGISVSHGGDFNANLIDDLLMGAYNAEVNGQPSQASVTC